MKKFLSILLALLMALACFSLAACSDEKSAILKSASHKNNHTDDSSDDNADDNLSNNISSETPLCYNCDYASNDLFITDDGYELCNKCYRDCTATCVSCYNRVFFFNYDSYDDIYCQNCYDSYYGDDSNYGDYCCYHCDSYTDYIAITADDYNLCAECYDDPNITKFCDSCGYVVYNFYPVDDKNYCEECYHN